MNSVFEVEDSTAVGPKRSLNPPATPNTCPNCGNQAVGALLSAPDRFHLRKETYRLLRCGSCSGVWLDDPPAPDQMGEHYTEDYHRAIMTAGEGSAAKRWAGQVKMISRYKAGGKLLDIGCSSGGFLSTMMNPAWNLYGIEMEESTAQRARAATGATVFVGDAVEAPFLPNSFDVITCFDVLEHVYSPRQFLTKVQEWLKPGGIYYAMMPNIASWEARLFGSYWFGLELPRHLSHFSPRSLRHLMKELDFEEACVKTPAVSYYERSIDYVRSGLIEKVGGSPAPQAKPKPLGIMRKAARKGIRIAASPLICTIAWAGAGPCLEVVFRKPTSAGQ
ncbi:MAG: methyltransferase domain-containing protein [Candidatus Sulfotelmatobacter sp.]|jgi:2-polyprenyl-3-methyl-5-hydroxy-6-metoxy-1,4-benzoquinol methylase